jgi:arginyl-tRNA synthetase
MATIRQRIYDEKADWLIYVTDMGQSGHFDNFFACAAKMGWLGVWIMPDSVSSSVKTGRSSSRDLPTRLALLTSLLKVLE